jgi:hypothetical protein
MSRWASARLSGRQKQGEARALAGALFNSMSPPIDGKTRRWRGQSILQGNRRPVIASKFLSLIGFRDARFIGNGDRHPVTLLFDYDCNRRRSASVGPHCPASDEDLDCAAGFPPASLPGRPNHLTGMERSSAAGWTS